MEEFRRLLLFMVLSIALLIGWTWLNRAEPAPDNVGQDQPAAVGNAATDDKPVATDDKPVATDDKPAAKDDKPVATDDKSVATDDKPSAVPLPDHPFEVVTIGSNDPTTGYGLQVQLVTRGAAVMISSSNDPRHLALARPEVAEDPPLSIVGDHLRSLDTDSNGLTAAELDSWKPSRLGVRELPLTLQTSIEALDKQLQSVDKSSSLNRLNWEVVERSTDGEVTNGATFRLRVGEITVTKTFRLKRLSDADVSLLTTGTDPSTLVDRLPEAYQLEFSLSLTNDSDEYRQLAYRLQGPVGVPLEELENSRYSSSIKWASSNGTKVTVVDAITADEIAENEDENERQQQPREIWHYVGVDVQYFAALLFPSENQVQESLDTVPRGYIARAEPQLIHRGGASSKYIQSSVVLASHDIEIAPGKTLTHNYMLYTGPKRPQLLTPLKAQDVLDVTNIFWIGKHISRAMLYFLDVIHSLLPGFGYGFAIIVLTISVRLGMHPLTRKQALSAKIMKDLKPEIEKIKEKHGGRQAGLWPGTDGTVPQEQLQPVFRLPADHRSIADLHRSLPGPGQFGGSPPRLLPLHRQPGRSRPTLPPRLRDPLPGLRLQPAAVGDRGAVPGQQPHVHAAPDDRRGGNAAEDDERDDDRLRVPVLPTARRPARLFHHLHAVGHG